MRAVVDARASYLRSYDRLFLGPYGASTARATMPGGLRKRFERGRVEAEGVYDLRRGPAGFRSGFKVPRYWEYRDELPRTPSERVAKHLLVNEKPDLWSGSYDRVDRIWR